MNPATEAERSRCEPSILPGPQGLSRLPEGALAANGACFLWGARRICLPADFRELEIQHCTTMPRNDVPPPLNVREAVKELSEGTGESGSHPNQEGSLEGKEKEPLRAVRPAPKNWWKRCGPVRKDRPLPYPDFDELDPRNDPQEWQYGLRPFTKE